MAKSNQLAPLPFKGKPIGKPIGFKLLTKSIMCWNISDMSQKRVVSSGSSNGQDALVKCALVCLTTKSPHTPTISVDCLTASTFP